MRDFAPLLSDCADAAGSQFVVGCSWFVVGGWRIVSSLGHFARCFEVGRYGLLLLLVLLENLSFVMPQNYCNREQYCECYMNEPSVFTV